ncbi:MAG TPA: diiron oxygenase [Streptosporangiaceae bacterium]|nr:diiron oxygenase [Streptosporangiaceae bacterium]
MASTDLDTDARHGGPERTAERTAERLLRSSAARGYDPDVDIDWSAPLADGKHFLLEHRCSLYGTPLWDQLSPEQRVELGKQEAASVVSSGIWLESVLMRMLVGLSYHGDPMSRRIQYALTELGEETRHTTMLARMLERIGTPCYRPPRYVRLLGGLLAATARGPALWGAILIGEEIVDRLQREQLADESIQPLIRMVSKIHVTEEARHVGFARAELLRSISTVRGPALRYHRMVLARTAFVVSRVLISPEVYRAVGLDPRKARRAALANPYHREALRYGGEKVVAFLTEAGLIGHPGQNLWRRSFLLG